MADSFLLSETLAGRSALVISVAALGVACVTDLRARRIPNKLNGTLALGLLALHVHGAGLTGLLDALIALVICFGVGLVMYLLGALGAGDVKLMAALSLALDGTSALNFLARIALAGGLLGVTRLIADGNLRNALFGLLSSARRAEAERSSVPYAIAIAAGWLWWVAAGMNWTT